jgi:hypothetical protein
MPQLTQAQIEAVLSVLDWSDISTDLQADIEQATLAGVSTALTGGDVDDSDVISAANESARDYASERAAELVGSGEQSIADTTRDRLREIITQSFKEETGMDDLLSDIDGSGIFDASRARMIARTEANRAELGGNIDAWRAMGNVDLLDWLNGEDACDECQGYEDGGPYRLAEAEALLDETHPNCKCGLSPHLDEGDE